MADDTQAREQRREQVRRAEHHAADVAAEPSNTARFLLLCLLCALLTCAYAWFSLARSADRSNEDALPPIAGALDAPPVPPRCGPDREAGNLASDPGGNERGHGKPGRAGGRGYPRGVDAVAPAVAGENLTSHNDARGGKTLASPGGSDRRARCSRAARGARAPALRRRFLVRHTGLDRSHGFLAVETDVLGERTREATPLMCHRAHFAAGHGSCLMVEREFFTTYTAVLFDAAFRPRHSVPLNGIPSRTRVSPDGRHAAITVFVSGHSYADSLFSTETSIVDTETGAPVVANMEELPVVRDGQPFHSLDFNFWGVTFAADGDRFFATLGTGGVMYLVEGSLADRTLRVVTEGIECPALSPDETRIAFKKRMPGSARAHWRPHVLDLETLEETALAETRSVDDQVEWLDDENILYALPKETGSPIADVWVLPADGSGGPEIFLEQASSPAALRSGASVDTAITTEG